MLEPIYPNIYELDRWGIEVGQVKIVAETVQEISIIIMWKVHHVLDPLAMNAETFNVSYFEV